MQIKGKYPLKETLEVLISLAYYRQTPPQLSNIDNPKTKPLLKDFPTVESTEPGAELLKPEELTKIGFKLGDLSRKLAEQEKSISALQKRLKSLEESSKVNNN